MKRLVLTFASQSYEPQFRVFKRELTRMSPDIPLRAIRHLNDPIEMLRRRPAEILKALEEGYDQVIFSGADQIFFDLIDTFDLYSVALFPHFLTPPPHDGRHPSIHDILRTGTFNSDLQVWNNTAESREFLVWYATELERECVVDFSRGLFLDQTYLNLIPGSLDRVHVDRSFEYNRAFYNLHETSIQTSNGMWWANGTRLKSFHFTGFIPESPERISKHQNRFKAEGDLLKLMNWYRDELNKP